VAELKRRVIWEDQGFFRLVAVERAPYEGKLDWELTERGERVLIETHDGYDLTGQSRWVLVCFDSLPPSQVWRALAAFRRVVPFLGRILDGRAERQAMAGIVERDKAQGRA